MGRRVFSHVSTGFLLLLPAAAWAVEVPVSSAEQLRDAVSAAKAGDEIVISAGAYDFGATLDCVNAGTAAAPITVRAADDAEVVLRFDAVVGFHVQAPHWTFEGLTIQGVCAAHDDCEHAFHITGHADWTVVRGCTLRDYNAQIKGNGHTVGPGGAMVWPNDVLIEGSELYSAAPRQTGNPVTPIDVVGGRRWIVRGNFIHDHAKLQSDTVSYAAFFKGNSRDGLMERNLVICELLHTGQIRLGLSLGGGGSNPNSICEEATCNPEHQNGVLRNNIVLNCPTDVGVYLNEATNTKLYNNTLINTTGVDVRFSTSTADIRNNLLDGKIRDRDGGSHSGAANLESVPLATLQAWFADPLAADLSLVDGAQLVDAGDPSAEVADDFCTNLRDDGLPDIGAVEYDGDGPCMTNTPFVPSDEPVEPADDSPEPLPTTEPARPVEPGPAEEPAPRVDVQDPKTAPRTGARGGCAAGTGSGSGPWTALWFLLFASVIYCRRAAQA